MNLLIAGGTGFIGQHLVNHLKDKHALTILTRNIQKSTALFPEVNAIDWRLPILKKQLGTMDAVINLVGENIGEKRWTKKVKAKIIDSRVQSTLTLCQLIAELPPKQRPRLLNASAIGIYGLQPSLQKQKTHSYDEDSPLPTPPSDFLSEVGQAWESPLKEEEKNINALRLRFGVVLHPKKGMLKKLHLPFQLGLGGPIGSGEQPFSWIALTDLVSIIDYFLGHAELTGAVNLVAPEIVTQKVFATTLAASLNRPCFIPMPAFVVKALFGQMGEELLLQGQSVKSRRLKDFPFQYPTLEKALRAK